MESRSGYRPPSIAMQLSEVPHAKVAKVAKNEMILEYYRKISPHE